MTDKEDLHISNLRGCIKAVKYFLENEAFLSINDPNFKDWKDKVTHCLNELFGRESDYSRTFSELWPAPRIIVNLSPQPHLQPSSEQDHGKLVEACKRALNLIEDALEEITWPPKPSPSPGTSDVTSHKLLNAIYKQTKGKEEPIFVTQIANEVGLNEDEVKAAWRYLRDKKLIDIFSIPYTARINAKGIDEIENEQLYTKKPNNITQHTTYNIITIDKMNHSTIQQGGDQAHMNQNVSDDET